MPGSFADFIINVRNASLIPSIRIILIAGFISFFAMLGLTILYYRYLAFDFIRSAEGNQLIEDIIAGAGGRDNIDHAGSGFFKLNIYLRDPERISIEKIQQIGVRRVVETRDGLSFEMGTSSSAISRRINRKLGR
jgi:phosphotransferase system IIB component